MNHREIMMSPAEDRFEALIERYLELDENTGNRTFDEMDEMRKIGDAIMPALINFYERAKNLQENHPDGQCSQKLKVLIDRLEGKL